MEARRLILDLSSDVGELSGSEGAAVDAAILECVTSANVACGGHVGDAASMARVCQAAVARGVAIGAQVSFVDREGFGRRRLTVAFDTLVSQLAEQLGQLHVAATAAGGGVTYMRPHGALYNAALVDDETAEAVVTATPERMPVLCLPGTALAAAAERAGRPVVPEIFADRAIDDRGLLVARGTSGAMIKDPEHVTSRLTDWVRTGELMSTSGRPVRLRARSICTHSDTVGAVAMLQSLRAALIAAGAVLEPFTTPGTGSD